MARYNGAINRVICADFLYLATQKGTTPRELLCEIIAVWVAEHRFEIVRKVPRSAVTKWGVLKIKDLIDSVLTEIEKKGE